MSVYSFIPKIVHPKSGFDYYQKIPKTIWQTMKSNHVPFILKEYANSWIENNPEYEYRFCDDEEIINFIKNDFPEYLEAYKRIKYGASKADLWRYLIIYKYGGVYADMDCKCLNPLRNWINCDSEYVTQLGVNNDVCQWLIISVPKNPIFLKAAQKALKNIENDRCDAEYKGFKVNNKQIVIKKILR